MPITAVETKNSINSFLIVPKPRQLKLKRHSSLSVAIIPVHYLQNQQLPIGCSLELRIELVHVLVAVLVVLVVVEVDQVGLVAGVVEYPGFAVADLSLSGMRYAVGTGEPVLEMAGFGLGIVVAVGAVWYRRNLCS